MMRCSANVYRKPRPSRASAMEGSLFSGQDMYNPYWGANAWMPRAPGGPADAQKPHRQRHSVKIEWLTKMFWCIIFLFYNLNDSILIFKRTIFLYPMQECAMSLLACGMMWLKVCHIWHLRNIFWVFLDFPACCWPTRPSSGADGHGAVCFFACDVHDYGIMILALRSCFG